MKHSGLSTRRAGEGGRTSPEDRGRVGDERLAKENKKSGQLGKKLGASSVLKNNSYFK